MKQVIGALVYVSRVIKDRSGVSAIEYALIAGAISIVIIVAVGLIGGSISEVFSSIAQALGGVFLTLAIKAAPTAGIKANTPLISIRSN